MTEEMPIRYTVWIVIIVIVAALMIYVLYIVYNSGQAPRLMSDILYWIPGMSKVIKAFKGM